MKSMDMGADDKGLRESTFLLRLTYALYVVVSFRREDKYAQTVKKNGERADTKKRTKEKDSAEETGRKTVGRARRNQAAYGN